jgi:transaldolase/glucose-6-phosphate isomerase
MSPPSSSSSPSGRQAATSPVYAAHAHGQSIWLDNISRDLLLSGDLREWVTQHGIRGVTSNPAIFENAIAKSTDYDPATRALVGQGASDALDIFEKLAVADIQLGCDVLRPVWEESGGRDGFVSLEVSPYLANDTEGTIFEARRLADAVSRDNLMIKVPATPEGIPAIQALIADGIHINVTLLFAVDAYEAVHNAYLTGLEARLARGQNVSGIASVASFFISRIDAAVGQHIDALLESETREDRRQRLQALNARVAIANAKLAYGRFLETLAGDRWAQLEAAGADPQRVLWASTGTKDPALPKTLYVDELIGMHTVNTLPGATLEAFRNEGQVRDALGKDPAPLKAEARAILSELDTLGISLKEITDSLLSKGCALFSDAFDGLLLSVEHKRQQLIGDALSSTSYALGDAAPDIEAAARSWHQNSQTRKLWQRRADLFSDADEASFMGWLDLPDAAPETAIGSAALRHAVRSHDSDTVVVIGMGGSSLWPNVLGSTFSGVSGSGVSGSADSGAANGPDLRDGAGRSRDLVVLDTTVPDALDTAIGKLDLTRCLFIVASKSGSTIEPNAIGDLLFARLSEAVGEETAARHFIAITDPGSSLEARATQLGFLGVAHGLPDVGGRFSALSPFGQLPAEAMGLDPEALQARARLMSAACAPFVSPERNPGVSLGLAMGVLARQGRDKLTLTASPEVESFLGWIDQLVAESTGKEGRGITPIVGEALSDPSEVGSDRVFVDLSLEGDPTADSRETKLAALEAAGHPLIRIRLGSALDLVQEVFRWEIATAVAGSLLAVNPFNQPDVDAAKDKSREFLAANDAEGARAISADLEVDGVSLFASPALAGSLSGTTDPVEWMRVLLSELREGDVFGLNVFLEDGPALRDPLETMRCDVGREHRNATTLAIGPRYLHSSGQLQKGGPNGFVGLQIWQSAASRTSKALEIPKDGDNFDRLAEAQAAGDFVILGDRGRRVIGIDVGADPQAGVEKLASWIAEALA